MPTVKGGKPAHRLRMANDIGDDRTCSIKGKTVKHQTVTGLIFYPAPAYGHGRSSPTSEMKIILLTFFVFMVLLNVNI